MKTHHRKIDQDVLSCTVELHCPQKRAYLDKTNYEDYTEIKQRWSCTVRYKGHTMKRTGQRKKRFLDTESGRESLLVSIQRASWRDDTAQYYYKEAIKKKVIALFYEKYPTLKVQENIDPCLDNVSHRVLPKGVKTTQTRTRRRIAKDFKRKTLKNRRSMRERRGIKVIDPRTIG